MARHVVATTDEIPEGGRKLVRVEGRDIVIFNVKGEFLGLLDRCPHQGGSLCGGVLAGFVESNRAGSYSYSRPGEFIRCPWHGWHFDIRTGKSWGDPARVFTKSYAVDVAPGAALAEGPYQAETVEVTIDRHYVVVET